MSITSKRIWANIIDTILIMIPFYMLFYFICSIYKFDSKSLTALILETSSLTIVLVVYFSIIESSKWQASIGKKIMGLILTDAEGNRLSFKICFFRALVFEFIWPVIVIYALIAKKEELLHDTAFDHTQVIMEKK